MVSLSATYEITEADFMKACEAHWRARRQGSTSATLIGLAAVILGAVVAWLYPWGTVNKLALAIVLVGGLFPLVIIARYLIWRKAYREAKKFQGPISIEFREDLIHVESAAGVSDLNWETYTRYLETPDFYILYMTKQAFSVIPKNAFPPDDRRMLKTLLKRKLGSTL